MGVANFLRFRPTQFLSACGGLFWKAEAAAAAKGVWGKCRRSRRAEMKSAARFASGTFQNQEFLIK
jgi:hypothetical protein